MYIDSEPLSQNNERAENFRSSTFDPDASRCQLPGENSQYYYTTDSKSVLIFLFETYLNILLIVKLYTSKMCNILLAKVNDTIHSRLSKLISSQHKDIQAQICELIFYTAAAGAAFGFALKFYLQQIQHWILYLFTFGLRVLICYILNSALALSNVPFVQSLTQSYSRLIRHNNCTGLNQDDEDIFSILKSCFYTILNHFHIQGSKAYAYILHMYKIRQEAASYCPDICCIRRNVMSRKYLKKHPFHLPQSKKITVNNREIDGPNVSERRYKLNWTAASTVRIQRTQNRSRQLD